MLAPRPNFYVLGAAKAGTTSLYEMLRQHPQVYMPLEKEPAYFSDDEYYARGDDWYLTTFFEPAMGRVARGEATPAYLFYSEKVAERIKRFSRGDAPKFIAIFREPASLVYSYYWNSVREGREDLPFKEAIEAETQRMEEVGRELARRGRMTFAYSRIASFADQLAPFLSLFPRPDFLFLLTKDLAEPGQVMTRLQDFLGLDNLPGRIRAARRNVSALPRNRRWHNWLRHRSALKDALKPFIPRELRYQLKMFFIESNLAMIDAPPLDDEMVNSIRRHYRQDTEKLQEIIQRDLSDWLPA